MPDKSLVEYWINGGLEELLESLDEPKYRAGQVSGWLAGGTPIENASNLPAALRRGLSAAHPSFSLDIDNKFEEQKSSVKKYLYKTFDGIIIESVFLPYDKADAICISTQAGCNMGCLFCSSGRDGCIRNLDNHEMLSQLLLMRGSESSKIPNIVLMGSGEPLENYLNVKSFIDFVCSQKSLLYSKRRITLSTCGLPNGIYRMIADNLFVNLAVSLHSAIQEQRDELMPAMRAFPLAKLAKSVADFRSASGRRVTYEYAVIDGYNDSPKNANALASLLAGSDALVNLIDASPSNFNPIPNSKNALARFAMMLKDKGIEHTMRRKLGSSINAACGQLVSYKKFYNDDNNEA
ncbi:MAG: radical SAM protein [Eubacteriaceae bacterium]|nr:radical SAM protein [Eubacteriaceae bacterium]